MFAIQPFPVTRFTGKAAMTTWSPADTYFQIQVILYHGNALLRVADSGNFA
jgi:hypothetical protein